MVDMFALIFAGLFTGFGVVAGQWFFERFVKHRLEGVSGVVPGLKFCERCGSRLRKV